MDKGKKIDLVVLMILLASIIAIVMILTSLRTKNRLERVAALSVLYNAGLGADYKTLLASPSYFYDDRVLDAYNYFADMNDSSEIELSNSIKMHNVPESSLFDYNKAISDLSLGRSRKEYPALKAKIYSLIESSNLLSDRPGTFRTRLSEEIYNALIEFREVKVDIIVGGEIRSLDLSRLDLAIVLSIMAVESSLNPFALMEERSIDESFATFVYSRGLMQIYEITLWTLNSWLRQSQINVKPEELWSVRDNIFLGMVYLAYANELLEEKR
ncbi:MAG TPA: transglycosylase [Mesotoga infera]|uniref:Transglycosylase n=1 Tax=Mesotoga infera TaxID=1236046 RepID=A0A7C1GQ55_9BACT|nr:transglycosylase [Mesotoga infera]